MRHLSLVALAGAAWALAGCHDNTPVILGPDTAVALHFDSLSAQAHAASQPNRVAALDLALRALADGAIPSTLKISMGTTGNDTATYNTVSWSQATLKAIATGDSVTDSLLVFLGWRGANADTIVVARTGHSNLAPQVQAELATLGIATALPTDSLASGALVIGNTVAVADSGSVEGDFGIFGAACRFIAVSSIANDNNGVQCNREIVFWQFALRFSPSNTWGLNAIGSQGVVIVH
jgi:hypothetical protein